MGKAPVIDRNGKLFGKISLIDIIVVVLIIAAGAFLGMRYLGANSASGAQGGGSLDLLEIKFYSDEVNDFVVDAIKVGDSAKEFAQYANFGKVTDVQSAPSINWAGDADGNLIQQSKEGFKSVEVTMQARGSIDDTGFSLDGTTYFVGKTVILYLGAGGFQGRISAVREVAE